MHLAARGVPNAVHDHSKIDQLPKIITLNKPVKSTEGRPRFELDVNYKEFPELEALANIYLPFLSTNITNDLLSSVRSLSKTK